MTQTGTANDLGDRIQAVALYDRATGLPGGGGGTSGGTSNAASPTYTEGATEQPISLDLHGAQRVLNMAADGTVLDTSSPAPVVGAAAHDAAISGAPVRLGARAVTTDYAAVAAGDVADLKTTLVGALVTKSNATPEAEWSYAAASGGISNTTAAVTIKAAAAAGVRNYITGLQLSSDALGAATEIAIRDGAGGAVLWRSKISTAGLPGGEAITFATPLKGSPATLLEVVTLTASVTGAVYVNAQGFMAP